MPETTAPRLDPTEEGTTVPNAEDEALQAAMSAFNAFTSVKSLRDAFELQASHARAALEKSLIESRNLTGASSKLTEQALRARTDEGAQAAMSADIDAIVQRLEEGIPQLNARLDKLLDRQRRPLTV